MGCPASMGRCPCMLTRVVQRRQTDSGLRCRQGLGNQQKGWVRHRHCEPSPWGTRQVADGLTAVARAAQVDVSRVRCGRGPGSSMDLACADSIGSAHAYAFWQFLPAHAYAIRSTPGAHAYAIWQSLQAHACAIWLTQRAHAYAIWLTPVRMHAIWHSSKAHACAIWPTPGANACHLAQLKSPCLCHLAHPWCPCMPSGKAYEPMLVPSGKACEPMHAPTGPPHTCQGG